MANFKKMFRRLDAIFKGSNIAHESLERERVLQRF